MTNFYKSILYAVAAMLLTGCDAAPKPAAGSDNTIYVSILPLRSIVQVITGDDYPIEVLVPAGAGPESFEPSARQFSDLNRAKMILGTGLIDFETNLLSKIHEPRKVVNLSRGIDLIDGSCSHADHKRDHSGTHRHAHGIDPHVWTSPRALQIMATNAYKAIHAAHPDSTRYTDNYQAFSRKLADLDRRTAARIAAGGITKFIIHHPALTYYARDYGLTQIAIEQDGKEPSARRLAQLIDVARREGIRKILYQSQYPASTVEIIARDIDGRGVAFDPLGEDVIANIDAITAIITSR